MSTIAATLIRDLPPLKVPVNQSEDSKIRQHCARIRSQVAPFIRAATLEKIERDHDSGNRSFPARKTEWPRHGHVQRLPSRASLAKGGMRKNL